MKLILPLIYLTFSASTLVAWGRELACFLFGLLEYYQSYNKSDNKAIKRIGKFSKI